MSIIHGVELNIDRPGQVLVCARDWGEYEEIERRPLIGPAGQLFDEVIAYGGFRRQDLNIANVVPETRPPYDNFKAHRPEDVAAGRAALDKLVKRLKPSLIITMGNEAAYHFVPDWPTQGRDIFGAKGIEDRRGYFWETKYGWVLTLLHPAGAARKIVPGYELLCLEQGSRVLTEDLRWVPIKDVQIGTRLIAFDEHPPRGGTGKHSSCRGIRSTTVTAKQTSRKRCIRIRTESGRVITCTPEHRFLTGHSTNWEWTEAKNLKRRGLKKSRLALFCPPWEEDKSKDGGWLAGFADGEGSLCFGERRLELSIAQNEGLLWDRLLLLAQQRDFSLRPGCYQKYNGHKLMRGGLRGGRIEIFRFLGQIRPTRLLQKFVDGWSVWSEKRSMRTQFESDRIVSVREVGVQSVVDITTTTGTFFAEGLAVHNCRDFKRAKSWLRGKLPRTEFPEIKTLSSHHVQSLLANQVLAADIETRFGKQVFCCGMTGDDLQPYIAKYGQGFGYMRQILQGRKGLRGVFHNGQYDADILDREGYPTALFTDDTQTMWGNGLEPEIAFHDEEEKGRLTRKGLASLASICPDLNVPYWKAHWTRFGLPAWRGGYPPEDSSLPHELDLLYTMGARDSFVTRWIFNWLWKEVVRLKREPQYRLAFETNLRCITMTRRGWRVNNELRQERMNILHERAERAKEISSKAALAYIEEHEIEDFRWTKECACCSGVGERCWRCAGLAQMPKKKAEYLGVFTSVQLESHTVAELKEMLPPCKQCDGVGKHTGYSFNPFSRDQLLKLLVEHAGAPKSVWKGKTEFNEHAHLKLLQWAAENGKK